MNEKFKKIERFISTVNNELDAKSEVRSFLKYLKSVFSSCSSVYLAYWKVYYFCSATVRESLYGSQNKLTYICYHRLIMLPLPYNAMNIENSGDLRSNSTLPTYYFLF